MEKINLTFYGDKHTDLFFIKKILENPNNKTIIYTPEGIEENYLSYPFFKSIIENEKEFFCVIYSNNLNFLFNKQSIVESYIDIYMANNRLELLVSFFIDNSLQNLLIRQKIAHLFVLSEKFAEKFSFFDFNCKLYQDDEDFFFDKLGYGKLYHQIPKDSNKLI